MAAAEPTAVMIDEGMNLDTPVFDVVPAISPSDVHVLLADDEKLSRMVISSLLRRCGYKVTAVEDGDKAKEALEKNPADTFQLVLSDVAMPGLNGPELLKYIRSTPSLHAIPVLMMSAHEQAGTVFECIRRGAEDYLLKPVTMKEVQHIWQHVYRRRFTFQRVKPDPAEEASKNLAEAEIGEEEEDGSDMYTVEEMRTHCMRQIERYQKVLSIIDTHPELFPAGKPPTAAAAAVLATGS